MAQIGQILLEFADWLSREENADVGSTDEAVQQFLEDIGERPWMPRTHGLTHADVVQRLEGKVINGGDVEEFVFNRVEAALVADVLFDGAQPMGHAHDHPDPDPEPEADEVILDVGTVVEYCEGVALDATMPVSHRLKAAEVVVRWFDAVQYDNTLRELED